MHLLFVTHYFHPEIGAPQTRILESARLLRERGHRVTVETGFPNYPDGIIPPQYRRAVFRREDLDGIEVRRTAVYPAPNRGFARRIANHASLALTLVPGAAGVRGVDAVIGETPPLFTAASAVAVARLHRAPLLLNVADLWPESAVQLGALSDPRAIAAAERLERFCYAHSAVITVPTAGMRTILVDQGQPADRVVHLPNAVDTDRFAHAGPPPAGSPRRLVYSGTVGMAQGVGTLIDAARELRETGDDVEIQIAGDGAERPELEARAAAEGLERVRFLGRLPRQEIPALIASADMTVVSLRDVPLFEDAVPTKMLEYMASGRAVIAAAAGEAARLVDRAEAGVPCPPEDPHALAAAIRRLAGDPAAAAAMGLNGRRYVEERLSRRAFVDHLEALARDASRAP
jgi:glycosyltransferase involved in cell wall biosynthesis